MNRRAPGGPVSDDTEALSNSEQEEDDVDPRANEPEVDSTFADQEAESFPEVEVLEVEPGEDVRLRVVRAREIVRRRSNWAMAGGILPIPFLDVVAVAGIQIAMVRELSIYYGVPFYRTLAKSFITALLGSVLPVVASGGLAGSIAKAMPFFGWGVGLATVPLVAGATTRAAGMVFVQHFESGGTLLDFDPIATREYFKREFEEAKQRAERFTSKETR